MNAHEEVKLLINWLMDEAGLSLKDVSRLLGVTYKTLTDIRARPTGQYRVSADMLDKLRYIKGSLEQAMKTSVYDPALLPKARRPGSAEERLAILKSIIGE